MLTIKQFLIERKRSEEEAIKLGNYLLKRHQKYHPRAAHLDQSVHTPFPAYHKIDKDDSEGWTNDDSLFSRAWDKSQDMSFHDRIKYHKNELDKLPNSVSEYKKNE